MEHSSSTSKPSYISFLSTSIDFSLLGVHVPQISKYCSRSGSADNSKFRMDYLAIRAILDKMDNSDSDYRYMAMSDLHSHLRKEKKIKADADTQKRVCISLVHTSPIYFRFRYSIFDVSSNHSCYSIFVSAALPLCAQAVEGLEHRSSGHGNQMLTTTHHIRDFGKCHLHC